MKNRIKGMSMCNPVDLNRDYLIYCAKYAIDHGYRHFEMIGPTHHPIKGNIDGMMYYRKYSQFNCDKDADYVDYCIKTVNEVCDMLAPHGIKTYYWHHELEIPYKFDDEFPEIHNVDGDVEVTHPKIRDFLENKIADFFYTYPKMDGIVLTLHETRIPLLKLKNQKLDKTERVKYVTEILYNACRALGKQLIVRPFASLEEDYQNMMNAYERISSDLVVCDKWTQFDWSLSLPDNKFFNKIKSNPLMVETDIFGEYFGKGFLPIMLKKHITSKFAYCESHDPVGYVSRIDRNGFIPFGTPNEVNLEIMNACHDGRDVDEAIDSFFKAKYGVVGSAVRELMENTEEIQVMAFHLNGFDMTELSAFPSLNASKNCYKLEMMRDDYCIQSNEWYIPIGFRRPSLDEVLSTKAQAVELAENKLSTLVGMKDSFTPEQYEGLYMRFANLRYVAMLWEQLIVTFIAYAKYFEYRDAKYETMLNSALDKLTEINEAGKAELGWDSFYPTALGRRDSLAMATEAQLLARDKVRGYVLDTRRSFELEKATCEALDAECLTDYVVAGGGSEGHKMKKEVNFSDSYIFDDGVCRIAGTNRGKAFSTVNAHGWFDYEIKVKPNSVNTITVVAKGTDGQLDYSVTVNGVKTVVRENTREKHSTDITFTEALGESTVRVRIDRISANTPYIYVIKSK